MTGTLQTKTLPSGNSYYYVKLSYKDPYTRSWRFKTLATKLPVKNNKRKAEAIKDRLIQEYAHLEDAQKDYIQSPNKDVFLCDYLHQWLDNKKGDLKQSTYEAYVYRVNAISKYFNEQNLKLTDITAQKLDLYFKYCRQYGKVNPKTHNKEPLAVRTVRDYKNILNSVFNQAIIDGLILHNPLTSITVHGKKNCEYNEDYLFLTKDEISEFLHFLSQSYPRLLGIAFMGVYLGLRRSEILGLKWSAIDFERKIIHINHTVVRVKTTISSDTTKTKAGKRDLTLFQTAEDCFLKLMKEQTQNKSFYKSDYNNLNNYVFTWEDGNPYNPDYIYKLFKKAAKAFGRAEITLHKLRHSCASLLIEKGWDIKRVQYWMGHKDIQTTLAIYSHFNRQRLNASNTELDEITQSSADLFKE